jgi:hypothetical protein
MKELSNVVDHVKNDLCPDFDYEEHERRQDEYERQKSENDTEDKDEVSL